MWEYMGWSEGTEVYTWDKVIDIARGAWLFTSLARHLFRHSSGALFFVYCEHIHDV